MQEKHQQCILRPFSSLSELIIVFNVKFIGREREIERGSQDKLNVLSVETETKWDFFIRSTSIVKLVMRIII